MKRIFILLTLAGVSFLITGLILRHDVPDKRFTELAKRYPQICHFPMGEGTLIDSSWVLTAGHVGRDLLHDLKNGYTPNVKCNYKEYSIEKIIVHPGFKDDSNGVVNDIALVKITGPIKDVRPAKVNAVPNEVGKFITIVGMGDIGTGLTGPQKWDRITRAATNTVDGADSLWIRFTFDPPGSENVTELEGVSGPGDSGGPAFCEVNSDRYIIGVSSHQISKGGKGLYGAVEYYSRVSTYSNWIFKTIGEK